MKALIAAALLGAMSTAGAQPTHFESGPARVALIELFTSEGCSSCPPADKWLGDLRNDPGIWREFVPMEFHVNYWDRLGWKDRLSTRGFTVREYAYALDWGSSGVYTPCFVRNGVEWKPQWGKVGGTGAPMGLLSVLLGEDGTCQVEFRPGPAAKTPDGSFEVHVALLGGGISSKVTAGENSGATLRHEFVVLGLSNAILSQDAGIPVQRATVALPHPSVTGATHLALAAWVSAHGKMEPIQATGGWLP